MAKAKTKTFRCKAPRTTYKGSMVQEGAVVVVSLDEAKRCFEEHVCWEEVKTKPKTKKEDESLV